MQACRRAAPESLEFQGISWQQTEHQAAEFLVALQNGGPGDAAVVRLPVLLAGLTETAMHLRLSCKNPVRLCHFVGPSSPSSPSPPALLASEVP